MPSTTATVPARDGTPLLTRHWAPTGEPWAAMVVVHGVGEHSGRYERTADRFAAAGIDVGGFDLRGHGGSGGRRGDVERWTDLHDDVEDALGRVRALARGRPVVLLGHSMGGLICLDHVLSGRPRPDRLVLSAPGLGDDLPAWQHAIAPVAGRILPALVVRNAWDGSFLSRDPAVGAAVEADPLSLTGVTFRLGAHGFAAQRRVNASLARLDVPTFVVHGEADPLVPPRFSEPLAALPGVTRRTYPGLRHESFNEPEGPAVVDDVIAWLRAPV
jgi:alpha-beta hydrolase superfamily lysophospholipase